MSVVPITSATDLQASIETARGFARHFAEHVVDEGAGYRWARQMLRLAFAKVAVEAGAAADARAPVRAARQILGCDESTLKGWRNALKAKCDVPADAVHLARLCLSRRLSYVLAFRIFDAEIAAAALAWTERATGERNYCAAARRLKIHRNHIRVVEKRGADLGC